MKNIYYKKKKGFTLVEVIIVLAIIAIIAAIAIPNLTKVRTESKIKADTQSAETIRRTVITLITDDTLKVNGEGTMTLTDSDENGKIDEVTVGGGLTLAPGKTEDDVTPYFDGIKNPQSDGGTAFDVSVTADGNVSVSVLGAATSITVQ